MNYDKAEQVQCELDNNILNNSCENNKIILYNKQNLYA